MNPLNRIFTNEVVQPKLFDQKHIPNQQIFKSNYLQEMIKEQQNMKAEILQSISQIDTSLLTAENKQLKQLLEMTLRLKKQERMQTKQASLLEQQSLLHQALLAQVAAQDESMSALLQKQEELKEMSHVLHSFLEKQGQQYAEINSKLLVQEIFHQSVIERIEQQEALSAKLSRQIEHLKAIIFEQAANLSEKLESSVKYLVNPVQRFLVKLEDKDHQK
ncbi:hypothetical protein J9303_17250 [Bacillaceae bacterium Marseille-Q3522]|nr:hypothetical protein [Bacillaceae bacterium Marseille-Q3522]